MPKSQWETWDPYGHHDAALQWYHMNVKFLEWVATRLFDQQFVQANNKENIKMCLSLALVRGIIWWPVVSSHKGPEMQKMFPYHDVIMKHARYEDVLPSSFLFISNKVRNICISLGQAGKLALARSPMRVKIWPGKWKTGLGEWNFV